MAWIYLFFGALFEIGWAIGLKLSEGFTDPLFSTLTIIFIFISFLFFTKALRDIDIGTGYAIFTGIGAAGTTLIGMIFLGDGGGAGKVFFIGLLIAGIIGLKMSETTSEKVQQEG
ncbi:quaternary ammonium compound-resistance protein SugE [Halobacillus dabanensis]|uniref:Quaternary ammonium compound-resistance protein SugE n=1 Tax=Halobacillus dabanensis TaxID=240302 RepID=A0A1I3XRN9_HALDA|nr:multidrug efflux SMR transporter [Halobacillus dabanensis]SFK22327.1 quaternary ammonium compound-resistance protein SugE [Halobacillus dabanensis]